MNMNFEVNTLINENEKETSALERFRVYMEKSACTNAQESFSNNGITSDCSEKLQYTLASRSAGKQKESNQNL
jgi:hypothetical protein